MKTAGMLIGYAFLAVIVLLLMLAIFYGWQVLTAVVEGARTLQPNIYVPLIVTVTTALLGLGATLYTQARTRRREIRKDLGLSNFGLEQDFFARLILQSDNDFEKLKQQGQ